jgi:hypothetical protein
MLAKVLYLMKSELRHRVTQLSELGLIPNFLANLQPIITQKYSGDITIVPQIPLHHYLHLISNPNEQMIVECIQKGQISTFPSILNYFISYFNPLLFRNFNDKVSLYDRICLRAMLFKINCCIV